MTTAEKDSSFEGKLADLEEIVRRMEGGELPLEASLKAFETGMKLAGDCRRLLESAEQKIKLLCDEHGNTKPFNPDLHDGSHDT